MKAAPGRRGRRFAPHDEWDHAALSEVLSYRAREASLGQHRDRQPLAERHAQLAKHPGLVVHYVAITYPSSSPTHDAQVRNLVVRQATAI
jgi:hypothetical protein